MNIIVLFFIMTLYWRHWRHLTKSSINILSLKKKVNFSGTWQLSLLSLVHVQWKDQQGRFPLSRFNIKPTYVVVINTQILLCQCFNWFIVVINILSLKCFAQNGLRCEIVLRNPFSQNKSMIVYMYLHALIHWNT
jgi:hypothetical protein